MIWTSILDRAVRETRDMMFMGKRDSTLLRILLSAHAEGYAETERSFAGTLAMIRRLYRTHMASVA